MILSGGFTSPLSVPNGLVRTIMQCGFSGFSDGPLLLREWGLSCTPPSTPGQVTKLSLQIRDDNQSFGGFWESLYDDSVSETFPLAPTGARPSSAALPQGVLNRYLNAMYWHFDEVSIGCTYPQNAPLVLRGNEVLHWVTTPSAEWTQAVSGIWGYWIGEYA